MPTYEFTCRDSGARFETLIPGSEKDKVRCPACQGVHLKEVFGCRVISSDSCSSRRSGFG